MRWIPLFSILILALLAAGLLFAGREELPMLTRLWPAAQEPKPQATPTPAPSPATLPDPVPTPRETPEPSVAKSPASRGDDELSHRSEGGGAIGDLQRGARATKRTVQKFARKLGNGIRSIIPGHRKPRSRSEPEQPARERELEPRRADAEAENTRHEADNEERRRERDYWRSKGYTDETMRRYKSRYD